MSDEKTWVCGCNYVRPVWASQPCQVCGWSGPGDGEIDIQKHGNTATDNNCHSPDIVEMLRDGGYGFVDDRELTAAAEIERLRARLAEALFLLNRWHEAYHADGGMEMLDDDTTTCLAGITVSADEVKP